ncbi:MAG: hypothetical protein KGR47_15030 [Acidobacteria bacterium]|nr:hypothetical protein [Acidobacteriota bacterium]
MTTTDNGDAGLTPPSPLNGPGASDTPTPVGSLTVQTALHHAQQGANT